MAEAFEILRPILLIVGIVMLLSIPTPMYYLWGAAGYYAGVIISSAQMVLSPFVIELAIKLSFLNKDLAVSKMVPRHVGSVNLWHRIVKDYRIESTDKREDGTEIPRFRGVMFLERPKYKHPEYGKQEYVYIEHNYGWGSRVNYKKGKASYGGASFKHGHRCDIVLEEQDVPDSGMFGDEWRKVPVYNLAWADKDFEIKHGDLSLEELEIPEGESLPQGAMEATA